MPSTEHAPDPRLFAGALLAASGLQLIELLLPRIPLIPWMRPGFSWIVMLPFLLDFGVRPTLALFLGRNLLSMAFGGQPASTFLISSTAGGLALLLLGPLLRHAYHRGWMGRIGASIALATGFNALQLLLVAGVLVGSAGYFQQIGPLLLWSAASGMLVAWLSMPLGDGKGWAHLLHLVPDEHSPTSRLTDGSPLGVWIAALAMLLSLTARDIALAAALFAIALGWGRREALVAAALTWPFLPYLAWFHLRDTPGDLVLGEWTTRQGVERLALQCLRLWSFTAYGRILSSSMPWNRLSGIDSPWARGFAMALPLVPRLFPASVSAGRSWWREGRHGGRTGFLKRFGEDLTQGRSSRGANQ